MLQTALYNDVGGNKASRSQAQEMKGSALVFYVEVKSHRGGY